MTDTNKTFFGVEIKTNSLPQNNYVRYDSEDNKKRLIFNFKVEEVEVKAHISFKSVSHFFDRNGQSVEKFIQDFFKVYNFEKFYGEYNEFYNDDDEGLITFPSILD